MQIWNHWYMLSSLVCYRLWWPQFSFPSFKIRTSKCLKKVRIGEQLSLVSTQGPPLDTEGASGSSSQNIGVVPPQNSLILIRPTSAALFDPFDVTRKISEIIKTKYERAVTQWSDFTPEEKEGYFKEFKSKFTWDPAHDAAIKKLWNKKSGELFRGMMHRARENPTKAVWIPTAVLSELQRIWDGPDYKKKREQGKKNRASEDSCSHTGGSIPHTEYRKRMKVELGRDPTKAEVFVRTHRKKSTQQLVDGRATTTIEKFNKMKEDILTQRSASSTSESPLEPLDEDPLFLTATGGKNKKNRVYGLGSEASFLPSSSSCSSGHSRLYTQAELEQELNERMARMNSELLDEVGDLRQRMQDQERMVRQLFSQKQMRSPRNNPDDDRGSHGHLSDED
ncbi:uncharacterized protein LOC120011996 [Tripterygium wilfordii]|uniref:uncharacterized protein LOC120011996 n=1 Tax=Tripterygium wilfordii TaxID=458696 RepID=UPI0018F81D48|nr:uncharacterized protein LOC120011996 [Tripterygium wilfordii]